MFISSICNLVCTSISWVFETWPNLTMQELMFQIQSPIDGTNRSMIKDYIVSCIPSAVMVLATVALVLIAFRNRKKIYYALIVTIFLISVGSVISSLYTAWNRLDIGQYTADNNTYSSFIDKNYADPSEIDIFFPEQKRNLIYIFLESMEITYADKESGGAFEENYIPELTELAFENEDFSGSSSELNGGLALNSTTWTAAALFAQTTGLPLKVPISENAMDTQDSFLPDLTALGDILEQQGYNQTFMIGSDGNFGGRSLYFGDHGDFDIKDYYYFQNQGKFPEDYWVWWGFEDKKLFEYAKEELLELSSQDEPFNLTMLTVDTHFEDGYVCELCDSDYGDDQYANVLSCSSRQISEFVEWIQNQEFYENTTIVISGDHLTMDSDFCQGIDSGYERKVYTTYVNSAVKPADPEKKREYSTFDNFPTTLASLGVEIAGDRLGLGTNLFSEEWTLTELYDAEYINSELAKKSELMDQLTKDIEEDNEDLQMSGTDPLATAEILPYDSSSGVMQVLIKDFRNTENDIFGITVAVWTEDDQGDLQWIQAEEQDDGTYLANIQVPNFKFPTGQYCINVYLTDNEGNQYLIAATEGDMGKIQK